MHMLLLARVIAIAVTGALTCVASAHAAYPGANGKIAFGTYDDMGPAGISVVNPDGSGLVRLTTARDGQPTWSPDGRRIAFVRMTTCCDDNAITQIRVMNADGSGARALTTGPHHNGPTWSPDGSQIAFDTGITDNGIYAMDADGGPRRLIVNGRWPAWAPDGSRIAYISGEALPGDVPRDPKESVWTVAPNGSNKKRVRLGSFDSEPDWSPDASRLAYFLGIFDGRSQWMDADGSNEHTLGARLPVPGFVVASPAWSPDGRSIAYATGGSEPVEPYGPRYSLAIENAATGAVTEPVIAGTQVDSPDWQPVAGPNRAPICSGVRPLPATLSWVGGGALVSVRLTGASDPDGDSTVLRVSAVGQDEPLKTKSDSTTPDAKLTNQPHVVQLREERYDRGNGRVYTISFTVVDARGASCGGSVDVGVPVRKTWPAIKSPFNVSSLAAKP